MTMVYRRHHPTRHTRPERARCMLDVFRQRSESRLSLARVPCEYAARGHCTSSLGTSSQTSEGVSFVSAKILSGGQLKCAAFPKFEGFRQMFVRSCAISGVLSPRARRECRSLVPLAVAAAC